VANVYQPTFDEDDARYAEQGFRYRRARLGYQAGCEGLGVSLWEIAPGSRGVLHFHFANEELLVAFDGRPTLLVPGGERELADGEVVAFPRGPRGAHGIANPGDQPARLLFFSEMRGPEVVIYPQAGTVAAVERLSSPERGGFAAWLPLADAIERHDVDEPEPASSAAAAPSEANLLGPRFDAQQERPGFTWRRARLGRQAGAERLGASLFELPPRQASFPFHYHLANEEMLIVLLGGPTLRAGDGERQLAEGEVVSFPRGERGGHQILNRSAEPVRYLVLSEMVGPETVVYPDSGKVAVREHPPGSAELGLWRVFHEHDAVDYFDGEEPPLQGRPR
jgi:uncharacterized cupin superfamily protein